MRSARPMRKEHPMGIVSSVGNLGATATSPLCRSRGVPTGRRSTQDGLRARDSPASFGVPPDHSPLSQVHPLPGGPVLLCVHSPPPLFAHTAQTQPYLRPP